MDKMSDIFSVTHKSRYSPLCWCWFKNILQTHVCICLIPHTKNEHMWYFISFLKRFLRVHTFTIAFGEKQKPKTTNRLVVAIFRPLLRFVSVRYFKTCCMYSVRSRSLQHLLRNYVTDMFFLLFLRVSDAPCFWMC